MTGIIPFNDLGNWAVGQLSPVWQFNLQRDLGTFDLTGVNTSQLSLIIYNTLKASIGVGTGIFQIVANNPAVVIYSQSSSDMATAGTFFYRVRVNFGGASPDYSDYVHIQINN